jgi:GTPase SAR1 family protein
MYVCTNNLKKKKIHDTIIINETEGVGKSSLISTFVSRHFSEVVPGIMTRVRLPPDPENSCITTIVDSQGGDAALISAVANMSSAGTTTTTTTSNATINNNSNTDGNSIISGGGGGGERGGGGGGGAMETLIIPSSPSASVSIAPTTPGGSTYTALRSFSTSARPSGMGGIENVDSIILIYDLDRDETFFRLENHWLPLIERCYNGGVSSYVPEKLKDFLF